MPSGLTPACTRSAQEPRKLNSPDALSLTRRPPQHCGICVRTNAHWPYHRAPGGAPPAVEVMDGKEEVFVVEAQPGSVSAVASLESLDVVDKVPDSVVTPFAMER